MWGADFQTFRKTISEVGLTLFRYDGRLTVRPPEKKSGLGFAWLRSFVKGIEIVTNPTADVGWELVVIDVHDETARHRHLDVLLVAPLLVRHVDCAHERSASQELEGRFAIRTWDRGRDAPHVLRQAELPD